MFIAGTKGMNGEEYVSCHTLAEAIRWMKEQLEDGFAPDDLMLYRATPIDFTVDVCPVITANGLTL